MHQGLNANRAEISGDPELSGSPLGDAINFQLINYLCLPPSLP